MRVGVIGASGYAGAEVMRLCAGHRDFDVVMATAETYAGTLVGALYPNLGAFYPALDFGSLDHADVVDAGLDLVFLSLPHGQAMELVPDLREQVATIVDLSADFRLSDASLYETWYGQEHSCPALLAEATFGLPELFGSDLPGADLVAVAGCYPTAAALGLAPLVRLGLIETEGIIVDAASGVSGAGRSLRHELHFATANEDFNAYGLLGHRHTPEIQQAIGAQVLFTPHLAPMTRGLLATCYARPARAASTESLLGALEEFYSPAPFVSVRAEPPSTKATLGSNYAHVTARYDDRTGWVMVIIAIDNLVKGAAGQAVQCANLALGLAEAEGLAQIGVYP
ncbi:MAG: N-acetyl-gamma-glutamyl-phosphate reductase [Acidimicrobiales bacterium]